VTVTVAGSETVAISRADFIRSKLRWRVDGSDGVLAGQTVVITYDNGILKDNTSATGIEIGRAVVNALGVWTLDLTLTSASDVRNPSAGSTVFKTAPTTIRATSLLTPTATATRAITLK
jgi:hypothetical protein